MHLQQHLAIPVINIMNHSEASHLHTPVLKVLQLCHLLQSLEAFLLIQLSVITDEEDDAQMEGLKPAGGDTLTDNEGQEETNKEDDGQTLKPADKKPVQKCSNRVSSGS